MKKRFYFGALALLGALIVQFFLKPIICCTANASPTFKSIEMIENELNMSVASVKNDGTFRKVKKIQHLVAKSDEYEKIERTSYIYETFLQNKLDESFLRSKQNIQKIRKSRTKRVKDMRVEKNSTLERNERSANLSHISGSARKIQLYIKNRFLQLMPDGAVNGTTDDKSDFSKYSFNMQNLII